jgi:hypothetical protein
MKKLLITGLFVLFFLSGTKAQVTGNIYPDENNAPEMKMDKIVHDYSTIEKNADGTCEFKFTNTGKTPLIISKCQASCNCTVPTCPTEPILPGKSGVIKVSYGTSRVGIISKQITVYSNAKDSPVVLNIKGNVIEK